MKQNGFLIVLAKPSPIFEEEFNAWYDTEHVPERLAVPGFLSAVRYVGIEGTPGYLAVYDTTSSEVFSSPGYLAVSFDNFSPWTKRVTSRARIYRSDGSQIYPGQAQTVPCARLYMVRLRSLKPDAGPAVIEGMRASFEALPQTLQVRVFAYDTGSGVDFIGLVEARAPITQGLKLEAFGPHADAIDVVNTYVPYRA